MAQRRTVLDVNGEQLVGVLTEPDAVPTTGSAVLLLHGGPGGTKEGPEDLFVRLASSLACAGVASARFDFRGEGESGGDYVNTTPSDQVAQYVQMINWLHACGFESIAVVGESFGATCALGGYRASDVGALILLWPAIWLLDETLASFVTPERRAELRDRGHFVGESQRIGPAFVEELLRNDHRENELRRVVAPTLLIHGDADTEVPVRQSLRAFELLQEPRRVVVVPGADHCLRRPHEQSIAIRETTDWVVKYLVGENSVAPPSLAPPRVSETR
jgi:pimeloyl-ACP methyl ester carboxylesterase